MKKVLLLFILILGILFTGCNFDGHDTEVLPSSYDTYTGESYLISIDAEHHKIHEGEHFFLRNFITLDAGISADFVYTVPSNVKVHIQFDTQSTDTVQLYVYEGVDYTGGTEFYGLNNNRNSTNTPAAPVYFNPTITDNGNLLWAASVSGKNSVGTYDNTEELILNPGESYLWRLTSTVNDNIITYHSAWYEIVS